MWFHRLLLLANPENHSSFLNVLAIFLKNSYNIGRDLKNHSSFLNFLNLSRKNSLKNGRHLKHHSSNLIFSYFSEKKKIENRARCETGEDFSDRTQYFNQKSFPLPKLNGLSVQKNLREKLREKLVAGTL